MVTNLEKYLMSSSRRPRLVAALLFFVSLNMITYAMYTISMFKMHEIWSVDSQENCKHCCHQLSDFKAKMHHIRFRLGLHNGPRWGSLQLLPQSPHISPQIYALELPLLDSNETGGLIGMNIIWSPFIVR